MAPSFYLSYIRSPTPASPPSPQPQPLTPDPLRIFKRPTRKRTTNAEPLATLASPLPRASSSSFASTSSLQDTSAASPHHSSTSLPSSPPTTCDLCTSPLSPHSIYSFPTTAPAITLRVRRLFPILTLSSSPNPIFCSACFGAIHAVHICWACGFPVYREEERVGCGWAWWHWGCVRCLLCRTPLPPPAWTEQPITLSIPPSCKACTRELHHLAYTERSEKERTDRRTSSQQLLDPAASIDAYDGAGRRKVSRISKNSPSIPIGKVSLGVKYPPLPKWIEKRRPVARREEGCASPRVRGQRRPSIPRWMEKLPCNVQLNKRSGRFGSGGGIEGRVSSNAKVGKGSRDRRLVGKVIAREVQGW